MNYLYVALLLMSVQSALATDCVTCTTPEMKPIMDVPVLPELIPIEKINYKRNSKASFCKRPTEIIDTIVLHHSETPSTDSPEKINEIHLQNGRPNDPWYMIAYSYVINSPYAGASTPRSRVSEGRPIDLVGAHAGTDAFVPMSEKQKKLFDEGKVVCGRENEEFTPDPTLVKDGKIKANVSTIGLVVIGNYAPLGKGNLQYGYSKKNPRYPTPKTLEMIAKTSCQLQKQYPDIKNIKWHSYYHSTSCPGNLKDFIGEIKKIAGKYGCEFN